MTEAAVKQWPPNTAPISQEIGIAIVYFYREWTNIDVDNIGKLIVDGIKGVAIVDDGLVSQVIMRKTNQSAIDSLIEPPDMVAAAFGQEDNFVYVALIENPDHRRLPV